MKAIDLHIHTHKTISDADFSFDIAVLKEYVNTLKLDAIAVTNHNSFYKDEFDEIRKELNNIVVLPGIEVNLDGGHLLVISPIEKIDTFQLECNVLTSNINDPKDNIDLNLFLNIFKDYKSYLLIPHYDKSPKIKKSILEFFKDDIFCGEVQNSNKFTLIKRDETMLVPVLFSDIRISKELYSDKEENFPIRITYIEIDNLTINNLKITLKDRKKVFTNKDKNDEEFTIFPDGTTANKGLNIIMGKRATGKTYLLNTINKSFSDENNNVKYIKQFYISKNSDEEAFENNIKESYDSISELYLAPLKIIINKVLEIDDLDDDKKMDDYLDTLKDNANKQSKSNEFSKRKIFNETPYNAIEDAELNKLLYAIKQIIDSKKYKEIISELVDIKSLKLLFSRLIIKYEEEKKEKLFKDKTDKIIEVIQNRLELKASIPKIKSINIYQIAKNRIIDKKFNELINQLQNDSRLNRLDEDFFGFMIEVSKKRYSSANDLKDNCNIPLGKIKIKDFFDAYYDKNPSKYIRNLKEIGVPDSSLHRMILNINIRPTDDKGKNISGGQRAEFILLKQLADATNYDILLIDEPESSFDNLFIKDSIIKIIQDISEKTTTFVSTHNNTLGVSIRPNKVIYTQKNDDETYDIFTGSLTSGNLTTASGKEIRNIESILNVMEAGTTAYKDRSEIYESFKN